MKNRYFMPLIAIASVLLLSWVTVASYAYFRGTVDGYTPQDFQRHCDNAGPTVCIVKTSKNIKFGGFLNVNWKSKGGNVYDKNSFLFNLNFNKIYPSNGNGGPYFKDINGPDFVFGISIGDDYRKSFHHVSEAKLMKRNWKNVIKLV